MLQDLKYAFRQFTKAPGFTAVAVIILALGIGANAAVFTVIDTLLLRGLPVRHPEELVVGTAGQFRQIGSYPLYNAVRRGAKSFSGFVGVSSLTRSMVATGFGRADVITANTGLVSGDFFSFLGVPPALGRTLTPADDKPGAARTVAVLSDAFWRRQFGADPAVIGKTIRIDNASFTIVGVAPRGFSGVEVGNPIDIWAPLEANPLIVASEADKFVEPGAHRHYWILILGRVRPGAALSTAKAELGVIFTTELEREGIPAKYLTDYSLAHPNLSPAGSGYIPNREAVASTLHMLLLIVGMVLVTACANVAGLLLARSSARQREFAVRAALGAARRHLIRQLLIESMMLALAAGALSLLFARWGAAWLAQYMPASAMVVRSIDGWTLAFAAMASVGTGLLVGILPVVRLRQLAIISALKESASSLAGRSGQKLSQTLVASQIAISLCLLAGSGLFIRSLQNLKNVDLGFNPSNLAMTFLQFDSTEGSARRVSLAREVWQALQGMPGVAGATFSVKGGGLLSDGDRPSTTCVPRGYVLDPSQPLPDTHSMFVGPGFLTTLGVPLYRGRDIDAADVFPVASTQGGVGAAPFGDAAVVNEAFVKKFFPAQDPLGQAIQAYGQTWRIVGVAKDVRQWDLRENHPTQIYLPATAYITVSGMPLFGLCTELRTQVNPATLEAEVQKTVDSVDPRLRKLRYTTVGETIAQSIFQERMIAQTAGYFSCFALCLASLGLYGALAYMVTRRTREIGVRLALGAKKSDVIRLVLRTGMIVTAGGCAAGAIAAAALSHLIASRLYEVPPVDPVTFLATIAVLLLVALLACWLPARRATKVDPMIALRAE